MTLETGSVEGSANAGGSCRSSITAPRYFEEKAGAEEDVDPDAVDIEVFPGGDWDCIVAIIA